MQLKRVADLVYIPQQTIAKHLIQKQQIKRRIRLKQLLDLWVTQSILSHGSRTVNQIVVPIEARFVPFGEDVCIHAVICSK